MLALLNCFWCPNSIARLVFQYEVRILETLFVQLTVFDDFHHISKVAFVHITYIVIFFSEFTFISIWACFNKWNMRMMDEKF
jgi:hypothetical protein